MRLSLGLYGLISFMAAQKTKEIGIRKVLGGSTVHIAILFGREFAQLIVTAALIAVPLGWWVMQHWLQDFKFQVPITPFTFIMAIGFTLFIALCTVSYQVMKSALANPVNSLRGEQCKDNPGKRNLLSACMYFFDVGSVVNHERASACNVHAMRILDF
jgi:putative ABC transport system permease protein